MRKTLCVDFDGVIHSYMTPWGGADVIADRPVDGAIEFIERIIDDGQYDICIYSARSGQEGGIAAMKKWFNKYIHKEYMEYLMFPTTKPGAYLTIDDRAICFRGTFPSFQELDNFKPWYDKYKEVVK